MRVMNPSYIPRDPLLRPEPVIAPEVKRVDHRQRLRSLLTILLAGTLVSSIAIAALIVNLVIGDLAEDNLMRIAEENTARNAMHMQAMMRREQSSQGLPFPNDSTIPGMQHPKPLNLEFLTSSKDLSSRFPALVEGLNVIKLNLFDLNNVQAHD